MRRYSLTSLLSIASLMLLDWLSKLALLLAHCRSHSQVILYRKELGHFAFSIVPMFNEGAAFGFFSKQKDMLFIFRISIVLGMLAYLLIKQKSLSLRSRFAFILVCAGALGNIGDVYLHGHVVDFLSFSYRSHAFPTFNLADTFIFLGTLLFISNIYFPTKQKQNHR